MAVLQPHQSWDDVIREAREQITQHALPPPALTDADDLDIAAFIEHTQLKVDATPEQIKQLCAEARAEKFATVCVRLKYVAHAVQELKDSHVGVACVVGFHEGTQPAADKVADAEAAVAAGANELDVVLNRNLLQSAQYPAVYQELRQLRECCAASVRLKLILETSQLSPDEVIAASILAGHAGFDFIKTSTGFCGRGASLDDIRLMHRCRECLSSKGIVIGGGGPGKKIQIKASGGIRSYTDARKMILAGASRLGTSSGMAIVDEAKRTELHSDAGATGAGPGDAADY